MEKLILMLILASTVIGCSGRQLTDNDHSQVAVFKAAGDIKFFKPMEGAPIQFGMAYGNTFETDHGTLVIMPDNFETPLHTHSNAYHAIVIEGIVTNPMQGQNGKAREMGPGSYWFVPAGQAHSTACVSDSACKFYMHQQVPFDFAMVP